jgi:hypothetical protein
MTRSPVLATCLVAALCASALFPRGSVHAAAATSAWTANGATACAKYLTPAVTAAIVNGPVNPPKQTGPNMCSAHPLYLTLKVMDGGAAAFRQQMPMIADAHPIGGIGDAAYWNGAGTMTSVKGDRECTMSILLPSDAKFSGAALAQKFGAICNQLFVLP